ncbi:MAG: hypothetical protein ACOXZW_01440 [Bacilli bacterium]|nr:hypothetical protein [Bacilli bacterium]
MRKILFVLSICIIISGCCFNSVLPEQKNYYEMLDKLNNTTDKYQEDLPFALKIYIDKINEFELMYRVIIDSPTYELYNLSALVIHNYETEDIYPSIGVLDEKVNLVPNYIDKENNYVKGINLIGYIPFNEDISAFKGEFRILVNYDDQFGVNHELYYQNNK